MLKSRFSLALMLAAASCALQPAVAQPVQYQSADGINNTPVSAANPLPVSATVSATNPSVGTNGAAAPSSSTLTAFQNGSGNTTQDSPSNPHPVVDSALATLAAQGVQTTGSAVPAQAVYSGAVSSGNLVGVIQADASVKIDISTATTTQLVALSSGKKIYVTNYKVIAGGTGNFKFVYGTGSACGTGTTDLEGANNLTAQSGSSDGSGLGPILIVPASNALCATTSAAVQMSGHVAYTQF